MKGITSVIDPTHPTRLALAILISSVVISALTGIVIVLIGDFDETEVKVLATAGSSAGFSILSFPSLFHLERKRYFYLTRLGINASLISLGMMIFTIWGPISDGEIFTKTLASAIAFAFFTNHALLMLIAQPKKPVIMACQLITIFVIATVGILALIGIWANNLPGVMLRLLGTLVILDALGTMSVPVLIRMSRPN